MKNLFITILALFNFALVSATDYYVSSAGNDSNNGTSSSTPWKTISKVNSKTYSPGDRILLNKGDIWKESLTISSSGNSSSRITYGAYGTGANPLIDADKSFDRCITLTGRSYVTIDGIDCKNARINGIASSSSPGTNIIIKNLTVSNIGSSNAEQDGILQKGGYLTVDNCTVTQISRCGIMFGGGHNTITNNRVSYTNLYYTTWGAGINGDGNGDVIANNVIDHCGGVGFFGKTHGIYVDLSNGDVHHNTITNQTTGAGIKSTGSGNFHHNHISGSSHSGIETGTNGKSSGGPFTVNIYYNILTRNREGVFLGDQGSVGFTLNIYNNVFYNNNSTQADNYYSEISISQNVNTALVIKNNIIFGYGRYTYAFTAAQTRASINNNIVYQASGSLIYHNGSARTWSYWQGLGYDTQGINTNPGLVNPPTDFRLSSGSPAIKAGTSVGLSSDYGGATVGTPPSIGAYESGSTAVPPTPVVPVYVSSAITNTTPSVLEMTYNTALANISPATSAFSVMVNSVARTVNAVAISSSKVQLTLASPIIAGDVVKVSYAKPSANPLQTASAGQAASISSQSVTNTVTGTVTLPVYVGSTVANLTPALLEITYSLALANIVPAASSFAVLVNSAAVIVNSVVISGTKVQLVLANAIKFGDLITVSYTKPATNPLQTTASNVAASISAQPVTNNLINPTKDVPISISLKVYPFYVHSTLSAILSYSSAPSSILTPQILRISNSRGTLFIEKLLITGITSMKMPINLRSGLYYIKIIANGKEMASQKMYVY